MLSEIQIDNLARRLARNLLLTGNDSRGECNRIQFQVTKDDGSETAGGGLGEVGLRAWLHSELRCIFSLADDDEHRQTVK